MTKTYTPYALAALRIVAAYLFIQHGTAKLFGFPHQEMFDSLQLFSLVGLAGVIEVAGGVLLGVGLFTRSTAFVLSGTMAVAYFMAHAVQGSVLMPLLKSIPRIAMATENQASAASRRMCQSIRNA